MSLDGEWGEALPGQHELRLGRVFLATVRQRGGSGIYAGCWIAVLNGQQVTETSDLAYAKGLVEWHIVNELRAAAEGYRRLKARAPDSTDLFPDGAWARWKERRAGAAGQPVVLLARETQRRADRTGDNA